MCYSIQMNDLIVLSALTPLEVSILIVLGIIVLVAFLAFRANYRAQMGVSGYIDTETDVYNQNGLGIYFKKHRKKVSNPTIVVVHIKNLGLLYKEYHNKEKLMMTLADTLLKGLTSVETLGRIEFDKFLIFYDDRTKDDIKKQCAEIKERLSDIYLESYGRYNFVVDFGLYENAPLNKPKQTILLAAMISQYSSISDNDIYYYSNDVSEAVELQQRINELKNSALAEGKFVSYIQPKVSFKTGKVIGGEILTRWVDSNQQPIYYPNQFIPLFESNGFIKEIDLLMLKNACKLAQTLVSNGNNDIIISLNFSKVDFTSSGFIRDVLNIISQYSISPKNIEIEITESAIIDNSQFISNSIMQLRQAGLRISMDDFGKDNSSLGSLSTNPFDTIKIDGIFFKNKLSTEKDKTIIENILNMLSKLKYEIVCECIEDKQTLDVLATINQDFIIQGNYISKPIPLNMFEAFVSSKFEFEYEPLDEEEELDEEDKTNKKSKKSKNQSDGEIGELKQQIQDMQKIIENQRIQAYEQELKYMREQMEFMRNYNPQQQGNQQQYGQPYAQVYNQNKPEKDAEIELLKQEIASLKQQNASAQQQGFDMDELVRRLSETQNSKNDNEAQSLRESLEKERKEKEELEALLNDLKDGSFEDDNDDYSDDEYDDYEALDEEEDEEKAENAPRFSLKELEALIEGYKTKYQEEWNKKAKEELKDGYYEVVNGLKYYRGKIDRKYSDKLRFASKEVRETYNLVKNEILQYNNVVNKTLKSYDVFYIGRKQIAKLSLTKTKVRVFLAVDPANYPEKQFPHRDVSNKKAHIRTPFLMMVKSSLSVRRLSKVIADIMIENDCKMNESYESKDYVKNMIMTKK